MDRVDQETTTTTASSPPPPPAVTAGGDDDAVNLRSLLRRVAVGGDGDDDGDGDERKRWPAVSPVWMRFANSIRFDSLRLRRRGRLSVHLAGWSRKKLAEEIPESQSNPAALNARISWHWIFIHFASSAT